MVIVIMTKKPDLLQGTLDMLILNTLKRAPLHGYAIAQSIKRRSGDVLTVEEGSLYPALQRLLLRGWVKAQWKKLFAKQVTILSNFSSQTLLLFRRLEILPRK